MVKLVTSTVPVRSTGAAGISLRDIVFILYRRRWTMLAVALPIILVGAFSLSQQTGSFSAFSRVVVELSKVDLPRWNTSNRAIDYDRELSTLFNIAMSVPVAEDAVTALQDSIPVMMELDPNLVGLDEPGSLLEFLSTNLDVTVVGESSILEFMFTSASPRISLMAVGALRDAFIDYQVHGRKKLSAIAYYEEQIGAVRADIDSLLEYRGNVLTESGYSSLKDETYFDSGQLANIKGDLYDAITARMALEQNYRRLAAALDGDPREFPMGPDESRSQPLVYWRNIVGKHEDALSSVLSIHTDDSVPATRQRELLSRAMESLRNEEKTYVESYRIALTVAQQKEDSLRELMAGVQVDNSKAPAVYRKISLVDVEIESLRGLMEDLQGKWGEVRLDQMADERVSSVVVLNEPELTRIFGGGKTIIYFVMIAIFGLALGIVAAFLMESFDHRVYVPQDVEEKLKLPVLASVTRSD